MAMKHIWTGLLAALLCVGSVVRADGLSSAHLQAARTLLEQMDVQTTMGVDAALMADAMIRQNAALAPYRETILQWASTYITWDNLGPPLAAIYADEFSEAALKQLSAFYRTPLGRKALAVMPSLARRGMEVGGKVAQEHLPELRALVEARTQALQKGAGTPAAPAGKAAEPGAAGIRPVE
jgi:uncharacterized protein